MGAIFGLGMPMAFEGGIKATGKVVGKVAKGVQEGVTKIYKEGEELAMQAAGGGKPSVDYRISHRAPGPEGANAGFDLSDVYPDDIYSDKGLQYYGMGKEFRQADQETLSVMKKMKGNPEQEITIYRAVPKGVKDINEGDWITLSKKYAEQHGEAWGGGR